MVRSMLNGPDTGLVFHALCESPPAAWIWRDLVRHFRNVAAPFHRPTHSGTSMEATATSPGASATTWRFRGVTVDASFRDGPVNVSVAVSGSTWWFSWDPPPSDDGAPLTGFGLEWAEVGQGGDISWSGSGGETTVDADRRSYTIEGLDDPAVHAVRMWARNAVGDSPRSLPVQPAGIDTIPPEYSDGSVDGTALTLTWNEALDEASVPGTFAFRVPGVRQCAVFRRLVGRRGAVPCREALLLPTALGARAWSEPCAPGPAAVDAAPRRGGGGAERRAGRAPFLLDGGGAWLGRRVGRWR